MYVVLNLIFATILSEEEQDGERKKPDEGNYKAVKIRR